MRTTKALLVAAAVCAAGIASSQAQVYSANVVGFVNITVSNGWNMIANQLNASPNNQLNTILPNPPTDAQLLKWDATNSTYLQADFADSGIWLDGNFNQTTTTLSPGEGAFLYWPSAGLGTLTLVGEVPQGSQSVPVYQGGTAGSYSMIGNPVPVQTGVAAYGFPGVVDMTLQTWNNISQGFNQANTFVGIQPGYDTGWADGDFNPTDPVIPIGQGCFIFNPVGAPQLNWSFSFTVQ